MMRSVVEEIVLETLREVQTLGGHDWHALPLEAAVIGSLEGFDSLTGIEATVIVEEKLTKKLGHMVALGLDSIFVANDCRKALTLGDVVTTVCTAMEAA